MIKDHKNVIYQDSTEPENCFKNVSTTRGIVFRSTNRIMHNTVLSPHCAYPPISTIADDYMDDIEPIYEKSTTAIDIETQSYLTRYKDQIAKKIAFDNPFTNVLGFLQTEPS